MPSIPFTPKPTPNPGAMKFVADREVFPRPAKSYFKPEEADGQPAVRAILALPGVTGVMLLAEFCTVNKRPEATWDELQPAILHILAEHFTK